MRTTERSTDPLHYRHVMGHLPTGVVAVSGMDPHTRRPTGLIVGTFQSLSLEPPLVSFSVARTSGSWPGIRRAGRFGASVLASDQHAVRRALSSKGDDKLATLSWVEFEPGCVRISGAVAWIDCDTLWELDGGDHLIVVARARRLAAGEGEPMVVHRGGYGGYRAPATC